MEEKGLKRDIWARLGEVSGVIHFYYRAAPAGGRSGKLFLKQSGGLSSELLPACCPRRRKGKGGGAAEGDSERPVSVRDSRPHPSTLRDIQAK